MLLDFTNCISAAGARVLADGVDTGLGVAAVVVRIASADDWWQRFAASILGGKVSVGTDAYHGANWFGVGHNTLSWGRARFEDGAWVLALLLITDGRERAVVVLHALRRRQRYAIAVGVASVADVTATLCHVGRDETESIRRGTGALSLARVVAVAGVTGLSLRALGVDLAANGRATVVGTAFVALKAAAVGPVVLRVALCVVAARVLDKAGVDTGAVKASLSIEALLVALAADGFTFDLWVSNGSFWAPADWSVSGEEAFSAGSAVAGIPTESVDAGFVVRTLVVPDAAGRVDQLDGNAAAVGLRNPARAA